MRVHLDTDIGGDPDDACALALLLGRADVELSGVTTTADARGQRAGCAAEVLRLAGRTDVPVVAGAAASLSHDQLAEVSTGTAYWPDVRAFPARPEAATELLLKGVESDATVVAIGPWTNLAVLERGQPGALAAARVVAMGGWLGPDQLGDGWPPWGPERDWNVQWDVEAARIVLDAVRDLTVVPLSTTVRVPLRRADLPRLRASGPLGELLARQSEAFAADRGYATLAKRHAALPDDLLIFLHDPLACAVAIAWPGAKVRTELVRPVVDSGVLRLEPDPAGRAVRVAVDADGGAFVETWLDAVERAQQAP